MVEFRCKSCNTIVPRGHRMQQCECGSVFVDWGAGGKSSIVGIDWPTGDEDEWVEVIKTEGDNATR